MNSIHKDSQICIYFTYNIKVNTYFLIVLILRLQRCTAIETGSDSNDDEAIPRSKPFKYTYEKEIVMYAYFKKLDYFSTECIYSPNAYRGHARAYIKDLEKIRPTAILDIIHSGEQLKFKDRCVRFFWL